MQYYKTISPLWLMSCGSQKKKFSIISIKITVEHRIISWVFIFGRQASDISIRTTFHQNIPFFSFKIGLGTKQSTNKRKFDSPSSEVQFFVKRWNLSAACHPVFTCSNKYCWLLSHWLTSLTSTSFPCSLSNLLGFGSSLPV